jgi:hypothetical protein
MSLAPRMRKVMLTDSAGSFLARFELPEATSVADVEKLFMQASPNFNDAGFLIADKSANRVLGHDETLAETSPDIGMEVIWVVIPETTNA